VILINLLPHREARRQQRKQAFIAGIFLAALVGGAVVLLWYTIVSTMISNQESRNAFLQSEIKRLDAQIADVATLKGEIEALKARQKAVEDLQADRNMPVYLLNDLVKQVPEGVFLTSIHQQGQQVSVTGFAQTNERISEFLRNAANNESGWIEKPVLGSIHAVIVSPAGSREQRRMFDFAMGVTLKRPPPPGAAASAPQASASSAAKG
jgi:type IV pilus assembly protein PilN